MTRVKNVFIYWPGRRNLERGSNFRNFIDRGNHRGASRRGTWTGYVNYLKSLTIFAKLWSGIRVLNTRFKFDLKTITFNIRC